MLLRATLLVALVSAAVLAGGIWAGAPSVGWGLAASVPCALSALGGAWWAERRRLGPQGALAVLVVGMLARMAILTAVALVALGPMGASPGGFVVGFAVVYLVGQIAEIRLLVRAQRV